MDGGDATAAAPQETIALSPRQIRRRPVNATASLKGPPSAEDVATLRNFAKEQLNASWKTLTPELDVTPRLSVGQEKLRYIPPVEGSRSKSHGFVKSEFGGYLEKAIMLKVDLKSTAH